MKTLLADDIFSGKRAATLIGVVPCGFVGCTAASEHYGPIKIMQRYFPHPLSCKDDPYGYICELHYALITTDRTSLYPEAPGEGEDQ
jgi:hypothetical protein